MTHDEFFSIVLSDEGARDQRFASMKAFVGAADIMFKRGVGDMMRMLEQPTPEGIASLLSGNHALYREACAFAHVGERVMHHLGLVLSGVDVTDYPHLVSKTSEPDEVAIMLRERLVQEALWCNDIKQVEGYRMVIMNLQAED